MALLSLLINLMCPLWTMYSFL